MYSPAVTVMGAVGISCGYPRPIIHSSLAVHVVDTVSGLYGPSKARVFFTSYECWLANDPQLAFSRGCLLEAAACRS